MELKKLNPSQILWNFDFSPRRNFAGIVPIMAIQNVNQAIAVSGFDRRKTLTPDGATIDVLILDSDIESALRALWPAETLSPCEAQRLNALLGRPVPAPHLLKWPIPLQNFFDEKQLPFRNLKPLEHLDEWAQEITATLLHGEPSASQIREILDLLCDLKFSGSLWTDCAPEILAAEPIGELAQRWIGKLKRLRFPKALTADDQASRAVKSVAWPRGLQARWERHGDQAGISIQTRVTSQNEWKRLKQNLATLELGDDLWKI